MKKAFSHTKVAVKLRKSPYAEAWFIYLEAYPVYDYEGAKPKRVREYLNRTITTPVWDKNQPTRGKSNGEQHYMPKRDVNGVAHKLISSHVCMPIELEIPGSTNMTALHSIQRKMLRLQLSRKNHAPTSLIM